MAVRLPRMVLFQSSGKSVLLWDWFELWCFQLSSLKCHSFVQDALQNPSARSISWPPLRKYRTLLYLVATCLVSEGRTCCWWTSWFEVGFCPSCLMSTRCQVPDFVASNITCVDTLMCTRPALRYKRATNTAVSNVHQADRR